MDLPATITEEFKKQIREAGKNKLDAMQIAMKLGISDHEWRIFSNAHPELYTEYKAGETEWVLKCLDAMKDIVTNPEHKQQFVAAKYLYELYSGRSAAPNTVVVNNYQDDNRKFAEIVDAETLEKIKDD